MPNMKIVLDARKIIFFGEKIESLKLSKHRRFIWKRRIKCKTKEI